MNTLALLVPSVLLLAGGTWAKQGLLAACSSEAAVELFGSPQGCLEFYSEVVQKGKKTGGIHLTEFLVKAKSLGDSFSLDIDNNLSELPEFLHRFKRTAEKLDEKNSTVSEEALKHKNITQQPSNQTIDTRSKREDNNHTVEVPKNSTKVVEPELEDKNSTSLNKTDAEPVGRKKREANETDEIPAKNITKPLEHIPESNNTASLNKTIDTRSKREDKNHTVEVPKNGTVLEDKNSTSLNKTDAEPVGRKKREANETVEIPAKNITKPLEHIPESSNTASLNKTLDTRSKREDKNHTVEVPKNGTVLDDKNATSLNKTDTEPVGRKKRETNETVEIPAKNITKPLEHIPESNNTASLNKTIDTRSKREDKNQSMEVPKNGTMLEDKNPTSLNKTDAEPVGRKKREANETVEIPAKNITKPLEHIPESNNTASLNKTIDTRSKRDENHTVEDLAKNGTKLTEAKVNGTESVLNMTGTGKKANEMLDARNKREGNDTIKAADNHQFGNQTQNATQTAVKPDLGQDSVENSKTAKQDKIKEMIQEKINTAG